MKISSQKGFSVPLLIAIIAIIIAGGLYYMWKTSTRACSAQGCDGSHTISETTQSDSASTTFSKTKLVADYTNLEPISNWKTYTDNKYGFTFQYPSSAKLTIVGDNVAKIDLSSMFPNLGADVFVGGVNPEVIAPPECYSNTYASPVEDYSRTTTINGILYHYGTGGDEGMGMATKQEVYNSEHNSTCFQISLNLQWGRNADNTYTPTFDQQSVENDFQQILSTFKFIGSGLPKQPTLNVISPNGGEFVKIGGVESINWNSSGLSTSTITVKLVDASKVCPKGIVGCQSSYIIDYAQPNTSSYKWDTNKKISGASTGPNSVNVSTGSKYKIEVCKDYSNVCDDSDNYFTITN